MLLYYTICNILKRISIKKCRPLLPFQDYGNAWVRLVSNQLSEDRFPWLSKFPNINGYLSSQVVLGRGLHQGILLSLILFLLVVQIITVKLN